jgi:predicted nuclease of predicted toxin-antitoxin system
VRLILDEMFTAAIAEQLRARGHDVISVHEPTLGAVEGISDADLFALAAREGRLLVTEDVSDFRRLERDAHAQGLPAPRLVFATNHQFPRGHPRSLGRLVTALDELMREQTELPASIHLRRPD